MNRLRLPLLALTLLLQGCLPDPSGGRLRPPPCSGSVQVLAQRDLDSYRERMGMKQSVYFGGDPRQNAGVKLEDWLNQMSRGVMVSQRSAQIRDQVLQESHCLVTLR